MWFNATAHIVQNKHYLPSTYHCSKILRIPFKLVLNNLSNISKLDNWLQQATRFVQQHDEITARYCLAKALTIAPKDEYVYGLLSASLAQTGQATASHLQATPNESLHQSLLEAALKIFPDSGLLWTQYWRMLRSVGQSSRHDSNALINPADQDLVLSQIRTRLAWVIQGAELRAMADLLMSRSAKRQPSYEQIGLCRFDAVGMRVLGWAVNLAHPNEPCQLIIATEDAQGRVVQGQLQADAPHRLVKDAGLSKQVGGFEIRLPQYLANLSIRFTDGQPLVGSPLAPVEPMGWQQDALTATTATTTATTTNTSPFLVLSDADDSTVAEVDVLIPVYEGREHVLRCIQSVLDAQALNQTTHDIIVLDDASQDQALVQALKALAQAKQITLVERAANLGFIRNINRGMALHQERDVVWLNADTRVSGSWLDRLRKVAYAQDQTASVTPWSNNGEAMSLSGHQTPSPAPSDPEHLALDNLVKRLQLPPQVLVAGCGFCFYVKRQAIEQVGYLDERSLIDGYGEETDWCLRAREKGWQHLGATNVFVSHEGGQSFGTRKQWLANHNNRVIRQRYPLADRIHQVFSQQDPLQAARQTIQQAMQAQGLKIEQEQQTPQHKKTKHKQAQDQQAQDKQAQGKQAQGKQASLALGLAVISDDLRQISVIDAWLSIAAAIVPVLQSGVSLADQIGERLLICQDAPGSQLLEKAGLATRIACPVGLRWPEWLRLLGVTHQVTLEKNTPRSKTSNTDTRHTDDWRESHDGEGFEVFSATEWQKMAIESLASKPLHKSAARESSQDQNQSVGVTA